MNAKTLLVCDLDNTLYDWVGYFVPSFYAMVDVAVDIMSCDREQLLDDLREVHQRLGDSEQPFSLLETNTAKNVFQGHSTQTMMDELGPALKAFNSSRKRTLKLHEGVLDSLEALTRKNVTLIAHTESRLIGALGRLEHLGILKFFRKIYCRERSALGHPNPSVGKDWLGRFPLDRVRELSNHQTKPNPGVLAEICSTEGVPVEAAAYVGDSVARDMLMAKRAGVFAIWAAYGATHDPSHYSALVRVSHWTSEEIVREKQLQQDAKSVSPDYIARYRFSEVCDAMGLPIAA
jgi:phosphoglycolate phosphatase